MAVAPQFGAAARVMAGQARLLKLDAQRSQPVRHLGVSGIPALILFRNSRIVNRKARLIPAEVVARVRDQAVAAAAS